ncbi:ABC-type glycerol-3-phosphate transport system permease component [Friedmanniella endophytica]|uniref:ABC-type glycerol-3-phosphate transport system permease component n=1 Tax=Microlunatus kandeliicorticis TaxID=1759536 RepID=A0A7W3IUU3_9ACTN|nr:carbohydrate ABC transporter permease [Microlunatus kandeliicorticis]MBA8795535.1 ABC-type glycerol-3-phosphate transport system permease component [Microlunatus kandeliicorticis]
MSAATLPGRRSATAGRALRKWSLPGHFVLAIIAVLTYVPAYFMIDNALRSGPAMQASPFALATEPKWHNFSLAWQASSFAYPGTIFIVVVSVVGIAITTLASAYAFARLRFREKEIWFYTVFGLLLIPGFITLIPLYVQMSDMGLIGTRWGLILPYLAGGQALGVVVLRSAIEAIPEELFEAAKIDGAGHAWMFFSVAVPLSMPLVIALALLNVVGLWGDYVLPSLILQGDSSTVSVAITSFTPPPMTPNLDSYNVQLAAFSIASVPIAVLVLVMMKYFVSGLSQSAVKL